MEFDLIKRCANDYGHVHNLLMEVMDDRLPSSHQCRELGSLRSKYIWRAYHKIVNVHIIADDMPNVRWNMLIATFVQAPPTVEVYLAAHTRLCTIATNQQCDADAITAGIFNIYHHRATRSYFLLHRSFFHVTQAGVTAAKLWYISQITGSSSPSEPLVSFSLHVGHAQLTGPLHLFTPHL